MVDLSKHAPIPRYRYGVVDVPAGEGEMTAHVSANEAGWSYDVAPPKLHYHRSGWLTLNATDRDERQGVDAPPLSELEHVHFMTFVARHPHLWGTTKKRASDIVFAPTAPLETLSIPCWAGPLRYLKEPHRSAPVNPQTFFVEGDSGQVLPTVIARLTAPDDLGYYVWLELHANREFGEGPGPLVTLHAHDHVAAKDLTRPFSMIGLWSVPDDFVDASEAGPAEQTVVRGPRADPSLEL